jgi:spectinomycin phosphotransferase
MLEKPDLPDDALRACLREHYGLDAVEIVFLPIGNDVNTAAYRVVAADTAPYFLKLRSGSFDAATVTIPRFLHDAGNPHIIAPIATRDGRLWARMGAFAVILFPFVAGENGFASPLSHHQWLELGAAVKAMHAAAVPQSLGAGIPREQYASHWRDRVRACQARVKETTCTDPVAAEMAAFLREKDAEISHLVARAEALGARLRADPPQHVLCHADLHAANVLIRADGALFIVDWDTLIFAPKERDLMFIGGGVGGAWNRAEEEAWFYHGYGWTTINPVALAYYRFERIVEDIAEYSERLLTTNEHRADRVIGMQKFRRAFARDNVVAIALRSDIW